MSSSRAAYLLKPIDGFRDNQNSHNLFVGLLKPFKPVTGNPVGCWTKSYLKEAEVDTEVFSVHSTRGASDSKAVANGMIVDAIIRVCWLNQSTF